MKTDSHLKAWNNQRLEATRRQERAEDMVVPEAPAELVDLDDADVGSLGPEPMDIDPIEGPIEEVAELPSESDDESDELDSMVEDSDDELEERGYMSPDEEDEIDHHPYVNHNSHSPNMGQYYPYESKAMAYLDILDNLPRHKVSNSIMQFVITILKNCGVPDVPSFKKLRKVQKELANRHGIKQHQFQNPSGEDIYVNDPGDIVMADWANPSVRRHMQLYPEHDCTGNPLAVSEIWHGTRWQGLSDDCLPPMIVHPETYEHFYVGEVCQAKSGEWVVPERWLSEKNTGELLAKARRVVEDAESNESVSNF